MCAACGCTRPRRRWRSACGGPTGLREWLAGVPYVERVSDAEQGDGGMGCSVIWVR
jgi:hypothetical protein